MEKKKIVGLKRDVICPFQPDGKNYVLKLYYINVAKYPYGTKCVLQTEESLYKTQQQADFAELNYHSQIQNNLSVVANPYLIYSVKSNDDGVHPCLSVQVKYGIVMPATFLHQNPVIIPKHCTSIRYDEGCSGLKETKWMSPEQKPNIKYDFPQDIKLPKWLPDLSYRYSFVNGDFFFEEPEFAYEFRDEMLMQQALRRYALYGKIEKTY